MCNTTDPVVLDKIKRVIIDLSNQKAIIEGHQSAYREAIKTVAEETGIPKKHLTRLVNVYHRQSFVSTTEEFDEFSDLYERLFAQKEVGD